MKVGETERMKEFGFKISQEDIKTPEAWIMLLKIS